MHRRKTEVEISALTLTFMIVLIIFTMFITISFGIKNKQHRDTIEIYEEYYVLDEQMDLLHRQWATYYQHYSEVEYYLKYRTEKYLRYLELKKIIGETGK